MKVGALDDQRPVDAPARRRGARLRRPASARARADWCELRVAGRKRARADGSCPNRRPARLRFASVPAEIGKLGARGQEMRWPICAS